jgi:hypothetical protein
VVAAKKTQFTMLKKMSFPALTKIGKFLAQVLYYTSQTNQTKFL